MKFIIKDEDGMEYNVDEVIENNEPAAGPEPESVPTLTNDEVLSLKKLATVADKLVEMITETVDDACGKDGTDEDEEVVDTDETETDRKAMAKDSVGSIKTKTVADTVNDSELDIAAAWQKRYGG